MSELIARSALTSGLTGPIAQALQDGRRRRRVRRKLRPRAADIKQSMIVAPGDARLRPRLRPQRLQIVFLRQARQSRAREMIQQRLKRFPMQRAVRAVQTFESLEEQQQPLQVPALELIVLAVDRMRHGMRDLLLIDVLRHGVQIARDALQMRMLRRRDSPHQHVQLAVILRKPARQLFANDHIAPIRNPGDPGDRIVIRDRDEIHPPPPRLRVHLRRRAVTLRARNRVQQDFRRPIAGVAMAMKIDAFGFVALAGCGVGVSKGRGIRRGAFGNHGWFLAGA